MVRQARLVVALLSVAFVLGAFSPARAITGPRFVCAQIYIEPGVPIVGGKEIPNPICIVAGIVCPHCTQHDGVVRVSW